MEFVRTHGQQTMIRQPDFGTTKEVAPYITDPTTEQLDIFNFIENEEGHGIIEAVAGSGKTTVMLEAARRIYCESSKPVKILFACYNKSIAKEIKFKLQKHGIDTAEARTIHQVGLRYFFPQSSPWKQKSKENAAPRADKLTSQYPKKSYLVHKHMTKVEHQDKHPLFRLASLVQATLTNAKDKEAVGALFDTHLMQYVDDLERQQRLMNHLPDLLDLCKKEVKYLDYDDMIWLPNVLNVKPVERCDVFS